MHSRLYSRLIGDLLHISEAHIFLHSGAELGEPLKHSTEVTVVLSRVIASDVHSINKKRSSVIVDDSEQEFRKS